MRSLPHQRFWLRLFGLGNYQIAYERMSHNGISTRETPPEKRATQVFDGKPGRIVSMSIISAYRDPESQRVIISHTRKIREIDFLHELIHTLHPDMPHERIDPLCERLLEERKNGNPRNLIKRYRLGLR